VSGEESEMPLIVMHKQTTGAPFDDPPYPYMQCYRTEVHNRSDKPLKIVWFEGYSCHEDIWCPGNVLGKALRGEEFTAWYTEVDTILAGVIPPGKIAVCNVNWHGNTLPGFMRVKWSFIAIDQNGNDYFLGVRGRANNYKARSNRTG
jgi:hypothetical protein